MRNATPQPPHVTVTGPRPPKFVFPPLPRERTSEYHGVAWSCSQRRWFVKLKIHGKHIAIASFAYGKEIRAAEMADLCRWYLQDFFPRQPKYNFPEELPPLADIPHRVACIREHLIKHNVPRNPPHDPRFVEPDLGLRSGPDFDMKGYMDEMDKWKATRTEAWEGTAYSFFIDQTTETIFPDTNPEKLETFFKACAFPNRVEGTDTIWTLDPKFL